MAGCFADMLTLVFTDTRGSKAFGDRVEEEDKALLDLGNALFRAARTEAGGDAVKTDGDAFHEPGSAVAMCWA